MVLAGLPKTSTTAMNDNNKQVYLEQATTAETNIVVVGAGAIGLLWTFQLAKNNTNKLSLLTRQSIQHLTKKLCKPSNKDYQQQFSVSNHLGLTYQCHVNIADQQALENAEILIFCVKSFDCAAIVNQLTPWLNKRCVIILHHNGMGTFEQLHSSVTAKHTVYALLTTHGALRASKHHVVHTGIGVSDLGLLSLPSITPTNHSQFAITSLLNRALPKVNLREDIKQYQWQKLAINCVINPITAIEGIKNGGIGLIKYRQSIELVCQEISKVAAAEAIELEAEKLIEIVLNVANKTADNISSMRSDVIHHRPTEINYINGYICQLAAKHNILVPENTRLLNAVSSLASD